MTTRLDPLGEIRKIRPVTRSETSALRSGRNAMPHGTWSPVAIVLVAGSWAVAVARRGGEGERGGREGGGEAADRAAHPVVIPGGGAGYERSVARMAAATERGASVS